MALEAPSPANLTPDRVNLWQGTWIDRFADAGRTDAFQQAQRDLAYQDYVKPAISLCRKYHLRSAKSIAVALDRTIQLGSAGPLFKRAARALSGNDETIWPHTESEFLQKVEDLSPSREIKERIATLRTNSSVHLATANYDTDTYRAILDL